MITSSLLCYCHYCFDSRKQHNNRPGRQIYFSYDQHRCSNFACPCLKLMLVLSAYCAKIPIWSCCTVLIPGTAQQPGPDPSPLLACTLYVLYVEFGVLREDRSVLLIELNVWLAPVVEKAQQKKCQFSFGANSTAQPMLVGASYAASAF